MDKTTKTAICLLTVATMAWVRCEAQNIVQRGDTVLAYGLRYDPQCPGGEMPDALRELLRAYRTQTRYARRTQGLAVAPLLASVRDQYAPHNNSCPLYTYADGTVSQEPCLSGCVATCMEQVLTYWQYPAMLADTLHGWETEHYTIDDILPGTPIDWGNILPDYRQAYTDEQARAVADLTYYCGVAAHMSWGLESSAASLSRAVEPLRRALGYGTVVFLQRGMYSNDAWNRILRGELESGRPVCYTGHNMAMSGHAFNIDGVDEQGYYHLNWGYGGDYDGYYDLDFLNPFEQADDATELGRNEGLFCNHTALLMHPDVVDIDTSDTLTDQEALRGVRVDTIVFRRQPEAQGYVVADFTMTNTTARDINLTFEALTYLPTDTAVFLQADYVALSAVSLAPGESKEWPVYCQFGETGDRLFAVSADDETFLYQTLVSVGKGVTPKLSFEVVSHELTTYGDNLTVTFTLDVSNDATSGTAGNLVTYCLFPEGSDIDQRHWDILSLPAGETQRLTTTFQHLTDGQAYELCVRCPWAIQQSYKFTALRGEAADRIDSVDGDEATCGEEWYDLSGRRVSAPVRGLYIKHGKKHLIR